MSALNDCRYIALQNLGLSGHTNDALLDYYQQNGATSPDINDAEAQFLIAQGATPAQLNDMWMEFLSGLGYDQGQINDALSAFWCIGQGSIAIESLVILDTDRDSVVVTFSGPVTGTPNLGVSYYLNDAGPFTFDSAVIVGDTITYTRTPDFSAGDSVLWVYTPGDLQVDGQPISDQSRLVDNQIAVPVEFESGNYYSVGNVAKEQRTVARFNENVLATDASGVVIRVNAVPATISLVEVKNNLISYRLSGAHPLDATVTWEYTAASGNITNTSGDPLPDVPETTLLNAWPTDFETGWDAVANEATTIWDAEVPGETRWDYEP